MSVRQIVNLSRLTEIIEKRKQKFMDRLLQLDFHCRAEDLLCERVSVSFYFVLSCVLLYSFSLVSFGVLC